MKRLLLIIVSAFIMCSFFALPAFSEESEYYRGRVLEDCKIYASASSESEKIGDAIAGADIIICGENGDYAEIISKDASEAEIRGFCLAENVAFLYKATVECDLNIRSKPSSSGDKLGVFAENSEITVVGASKGNWYPVEGTDKSGKEVSGYCHKDYINLGDKILADYTANNESGTVPNNISPETSIVIGIEPVAGNLPERNSERWYKFENKIQGDIVINLVNTDNIKNTWSVDLYKSDKTTHIDQYVLSGTGYSQLIRDFAAGEYYLKLTNGAHKLEYNPPTNLNYTISVKTLTDVKSTPDENGLYVFEKAGEWMFSANGHFYYKESDGKAIVGKCVIDGEPYLMLVGKNEEFVRYNSSALGYDNIMPERFSYDDARYYYSLIKLERDETVPTEFYVCHDEDADTPEEFAEELLNLYNGKTIGGTDRFFRKLGGFLTEYGGIIIAVIVIVIIIIIEICIHLDKGGGGGGGGGDYRAPTEQDLKDMMDDEIAKGIIDSIGGSDGM